MYSFNRLRPWFILAEIADGPGFPHLLAHFSFFKHRKRNDLHLRVFGVDEAARVYAAHMRHPDIHDNRVRQELPRQLDRRFTVGRFPHDLDIGRIAEQIAQQYARHVIVIGY